jgi:hypothetical protein
VLFPSLRHQVFSFIKEEPKRSKQVSDYADFNNIFFDSLKTFPDKFQDKIITIKGYAQLGFEHCAIYKTEYFTNTTSDTMQAFWLDVRPTDSLTFSYQDIEYDLRDVDMKSFYKIFDNKFVEIVGRFNANNKGHFDLYLGSIENISSIKIYIKTFPGIII